MENMQTNYNCPQCRGDGGYDNCICGGSGYNNNFDPMEVTIDQYYRNWDNFGLNRIDSFFKKIANSTDISDKQLDTLLGMRIHLERLAIDQTENLIKRWNNIMFRHKLYLINKQIASLETHTTWFTIFTSDNSCEIGKTSINRYKGRCSYESEFSKNIVFKFKKDVYLTMEEVYDNLALLDRIKTCSHIKGGPFDYFYDKGKEVDHIILESKTDFIKVDIVSDNTHDKCYSYVIRRKTFENIIREFIDKVQKSHILKARIYNYDKIKEGKWH